MKRRLLLVTVVVVLVGAGVYMLTRPAGPAVELALRASELGTSWKADRLQTYYDGRVITQDFLKTIEVDEDTRLFSTVYQKIAIYPTTQATFEDEDFGPARERLEPLGLSFWDESYAGHIMDGFGIALRRASTVVILIWREGNYPRDPMTGEFASGYGGNFTPISPDEEERVVSFLSGLAQVVEGRMAERTGH